MKDFLTEAESNAVVAFCANVVMYNAVKKVILHTITHQGTLAPGEPAEQKNWVFGIGASTLGTAQTNEALGEELKASLRGLGYLEDGFTKLKDVRVEIPKVRKINPAL
jgi:hypothetical protein